MNMVEEDKYDNPDAPRSPLLPEEPGNEDGGEQIPPMRIPGKSINRKIPQTIKINIGPKPTPGNPDERTPTFNSLLDLRKSAFAHGQLSPQLTPSSPRSPVYRSHSPRPYSPARRFTMTSASTPKAKKPQVKAKPRSAAVSRSISQEELKAADTNAKEEVKDIDHPVPERLRGRNRKSKRSTNSKHKTLPTSADKTRSKALRSASKKKKSHVAAKVRKMVANRSHRTLSPSHEASTSKKTKLRKSKSSKSLKAGSPPSSGALKPKTTKKKLKSSKSAKSIKASSSSKKLASSPQTSSTAKKPSSASKAARKRPSSGTKGSSRFKTATPELRPSSAKSNRYKTANFDGKSKTSAHRIQTLKKLKKSRRRAQTLDHPMVEKRIKHKTKKKKKVSKHLAPLLEEEQLNVPRKFGNVLDLDIGGHLDVRDSFGKWVAAEIVSKERDLLQIHYEGWDDNWDEVINLCDEMHRIAPYGSKSAGAKCGDYNVGADVIVSGMSALIKSTLKDLKCWEFRDGSDGMNPLPQWLDGVVCDIDGSQLRIKFEIFRVAPPASQPLKLLKSTSLQSILSQTTDSDQPSPMRVKTKRAATPKVRSPSAKPLSKPRFHTSRTSKPSARSKSAKHKRTTSSTLSKKLKGALKSSKSSKGSLHKKKNALRSSKLHSAPAVPISFSAPSVVSSVVSVATEPGPNAASKDNPKQLKLWFRYDSEDVHLLKRA